VKTGTISVALGQSQEYNYSKKGNESDEGAEQHK
jgi:hypothetical protein